MIQTDPSDRFMASPYIYFGKKDDVVDVTWSRFGKVPNYVEPFFGSGAMLFGRPIPFSGRETVNDMEGMIVNFWRAVKSDPEKVAHYADQPIFESDKHAQHAYLTVRRKNLSKKLEGDPDWYNAKAAGWWVWGLSTWIAGGFCSGVGPWQSVEMEDGGRELMKVEDSDGNGISRQLPCMSNQGVNRVLGKTPEQRQKYLITWMTTLSRRLVNTRVCCGDWKRIMGPAVTTQHGVTAIMLDPPYASDAGDGCSTGIYANEDKSVSGDVRKWCIENGDDPLLRIALCGYESEHKMPDNWEVYKWKTSGGFGNQGDGRGRENARRERIWFSPHCVKSDDAVRELWGV